MTVELVRLELAEVRVAVGPSISAMPLHHIILPLTLDPTDLIDDYTQISRWSKYLDLTWSFISSYETQAREEYGIPFPLSWLAVLASFGALLYMFSRVRKWMAPPPGEPLMCNRTDVDDLSAQILMIRSLKDRSFGNTSSAPLDLSAIDSAFDQVEAKMQEISDR